MTIDSKASAGETGRNADSLYQSMQDALSLLSRARDLLHTKDPPGENRQIAAKLLVHTPLGDSIREAIARVASWCQKTLVSQDKKTDLDALLTQPRAIADPSQWVRYFTDTPTVGAQTILSYFESQCTKAATFTLRDVNEQLK
jgi:hypothetical protein